MSHDARKVAKPEEAARQWLDKHTTMATDTRSTIAEPWEAVSYAVHAMVIRHERQVS
jgi:hypothetical protein